MEKKPDRRTYSYFVSRSPADQEFVATFLELPGLSGLAPTVHEAILELNEALEAWIATARDEELPSAAFKIPVVIIDRSFLGSEPLWRQLCDVLPEELQQNVNLSRAENAYGGAEYVRTASVRYSKDKPVVQI